MGWLYFVLVIFMGSESKSNQEGKTGCRRSEITHSDVVMGRSLIPHLLNSTDTTFLGTVKNMGDCLALCCSVFNCNFAMLKKGLCYGTKCLDKELCHFDNITIPEEGTQLSLLLRGSDSKNYLWLLTYNILVIVCFVLTVCGTLAGLFMFYRNSTISSSASTNEHIYINPIMDNSNEEKKPLPPLV